MADSTKGQGAPWRDEETLREEYVHKQRSSTELAEEWGCSHTTVNRWLRRYDFDKYRQLLNFRLPARSREEGISGGRNSLGGYEIIEITASDGRTKRAMHHRLLAVAEWGLDAVRGKEVHHQDNIPWDNRPDNLELLTKAEHRREHEGTEMVDGEPWYAEDNLRRLYHELEWPSSKIAEKYDVRDETVIDHMEKHGIERRSKSEANRLRHQDATQQTLDVFAGDD